MAIEWEEISEVVEWNAGPVQMPDGTTRLAVITPERGWYYIWGYVSDAVERKFIDSAFTIGAAKSAAETSLHQQEGTT